MKNCITFLLCLIFSLGQAQNSVLLKKDLDYYLPDISYDENITSPEEFLGYQIGEWHITHDQIVAYLRQLATESDRVTIETYAYSHERRALILLTISSPDNQKNIDNIRRDHVNLTDPSVSQNIDISEQPIVFYQGYSVHGNESSGANAAILVAYYLAAGQSETVKKLLEKSVVLLDPCYNPDGLNRFASWANTHKSDNLVSDSNDREYNEVWPGGRTNHYWFDLNRDWLLLTHPESRGRIASFQKWKPNILTDHHEMGTNSTFFFQPGVPERTNPNTPQLNQDLTEKIGLYHAKALDKIGSLYYSKESFDDFYYGKGSTYPDIQGSIGILFEQASSRGHYQESVNGILTFPFTIRNQVVTSLSTQEAGIELKDEILAFQRDFYKDAQREAVSKSIKSYKIPKYPDYNKAAYFADVLMQHDIKVYDDGLGAMGHFCIPNEQKQSKLIQTIFEEVKEFRVNIFYDVSAWTFPLAFDINTEASSTWTPGEYTLLESKPSNQIDFELSDTYIAYAILPNDVENGRLISRLLRNKVKVLSMREGFEATVKGKKKVFPRGTMIIPKESPQVAETLKNICVELGIMAYGLSTGFNNEGIMLGSPSTTRLQKVEALMLIGEGVNAYDAGEIWHHMDKNLELSLSKVEINRFTGINLDRYTTIIMPDGHYRGLGTKAADKLKSWVEAGGHLIAFKEAIRTLDRRKIIQADLIATVKTDYKDDKYGDSKEKSAEHVIGGAIFVTEVDVTYPLFFGYPDETLPVFKRGTLALKADSSSLAIPMLYADLPLVSGYSSSENVDRIAESAGLIVYRVGRGKVICSVDNPLFRGYWFAGHKLFENMLYLSSGIGRKGMK